MFSTGKRAFIAGVADDNGYGWAIAKALAAAGAEILVGTWVPVCQSMPPSALFKLPHPPHNFSHGLFLIKCSIV